jgi:hypothetical protein
MLTKTIADELEAVARIHEGLLRPMDVVDYARNPNTVLHSKFEWDNTKAAEEYRLWQAREIIVQVKVQMVQGLKQQDYQVYVSLREDRQQDGGGYRYLVDVMKNPSRRAMFLAEALADFEVWKRKYSALTELASIFDAHSKAFKGKGKP